MAFTHTDDPRRFLIVTHARSASNLFMRMLLSQQPAASVSSYNFGVNIINVRDSLVNTAFEENEQKADIKATYADSIRKLLAHYVDAGSEGKIGFAKEHATFALRPQLKYQSNTLHRPYLPPTRPILLLDGKSASSTSPLFLPDEFLSGTNLIFLIRHPALMIPSYLRVISEGIESISMADATLRWSRMVYDWYCQRADEAGRLEADPFPIIIDAADFMTDPSILRKLCTLTGLDPEKVAYNWPAATEEQKAGWLPVSVKMERTLHDSEGLVREKVVKEVDLEGEVEKWKGEFGEETAEKMERIVREEMVHYEYLRGKRLLPDGGG